MFATAWRSLNPALIPGPRMISGHLPEGDAVLAVEKPVVGREDDERVRELAALLEPVDDTGDRLVDREQRLELGPIATGDLGNLLFVEQPSPADPGRLV